MSSAKAALESDTKVLAWEAGRKWNVRVNTISAGTSELHRVNITRESADFCSPSITEDCLVHSITVSSRPAS